jgi:hypothetical protein
MHFTPEVKLAHKHQKPGMGNFHKKTQTVIALFGHEVQPCVIDFSGKKTSNFPFLLHISI